MMRLLGMPRVAWLATGLGDDVPGAEPAETIEEARGTEEGRPQLERGRRAQKHRGRWGGRKGE